MAAMRSRVPKNETSEAECLAIVLFGCLAFVAKMTSETGSKWDVYCPDSGLGKGRNHARFMV
jgi:hypothetical protein